VELRERFAVVEEVIPGSLTRLRSSGCAEEAVWLSTCNRVELYVTTDAARVDLVRRFLIEASRVDADPLGETLYLLREPESIEHLFRVACGLDSMVLGETEILGQLKRAYELAKQHGHTGALLNRAFQRAFNVAKQVRSETNIQRGGISVASVAVELVEHIFEAVNGRRILVIGAGDTGQKAARALLSRGASQVLLYNRSATRAGALAAELGPDSRVISDWSAAALEVDVLICSTSAGGIVIDAPTAEKLTIARGKRPWLLIDLAVPRNIDPTANQLPGVYLFNVDDLQAIADAHLQEREAEVARCNELIRQKVAHLIEATSWPRTSHRDPLSAHA
jgi:glutamyl-tRNA reductase